jgi:hypothetical protein
VPVAAPTLIAPVVAAPLAPQPLRVAPTPPPVPARAEAQKESHTTHTDIDLPPYFEPRPPSYVADEESDPDLLRRFETEVVERRKRLTRIVATVMGVAWMLCQIACARSIAGSMVDAISGDDPPPAPAAKAVVVKTPMKVKASK